MATRGNHGRRPPEEDPLYVLQFDDVDGATDDGFTFLPPDEVSDSITIEGHPDYPQDVVEPTAAEEAGVALTAQVATADSTEVVEPLDPDALFDPETALEDSAASAAATHEPVEPPPAETSEPLWESAEPVGVADEASVDERELLNDTESLIDRELLEEFARFRWLGRLTLARIGWWMTAVCAVALPIIVAVGWPYYSLPLAERPLHRYHDMLRPSGWLGLSLGVAGTALILISLVYVLRKAAARWRPGFGSLQGWMRFHVATGLLGPAMIVVHTAFLPTSALGLISATAMLVVVASGIAGRYLLSYIPRTIEGDAGAEDVGRRLAVYRRKLIDLGIDPSLFENQAAAVSSRRPPWFVVAVWRVMVGDADSRRELRRLRHAVRTSPDQEQAGLLFALVRRHFRERQFFVRHQELRRLVGAWRFLHRWLAVVLCMGAFLHILVAIKYGGLWILGGRG